MTSRGGYILEKLLVHIYRTNLYKNSIKNSIEYDKNTPTHTILYICEHSCSKIPRFQWQYDIEMINSQLELKKKNAVGTYLMQFTGPII